MAKMRGATIIDTERCKGCGLCVVACPFKVLALSTKHVNQKGYNYVEAVQADACTGCTSCAIVCPEGCITVYRKKED